MDYIDRSALGKYRDPARLARSAYVHCLMKRLSHWLKGLVSGAPQAASRTAPCG